MRRLTTGILSEKCVVRRFRRCADVIVRTYINLDTIAYYTPRLYGIAQGFSKGVPRNFWTVPREKVLGKCENIKKGLCIKYLSSVTY